MKSNTEARRIAREMSGAKAPRQAALAKPCEDGRHEDIDAGCLRAVAADAEIARLRDWLEAIERITDDEIKARFRTSSHKSEEAMAKGSKVYPLLQIPRDLARNALRGDLFVKSEVGQ